MPTFLLISLFIATFIAILKAKELLPKPCLAAIVVNCPGNKPPVISSSALIPVSINFPLDRLARVVSSTASSTASLIFLIDLILVPQKAEIFPNSSSKFVKILLESLP